MAFVLEVQERCTRSTWPLYSKYMNHVLSQKRHLTADCNVGLQPDGMRLRVNVKNASLLKALCWDWCSTVAQSYPTNVLPIGWLSI